MNTNSLSLLSEKRLTLAELARAKGVATISVRRWASTGCRGHVLETFVIGGRRYTTEECWERFFERSNGASAPASPTLRQCEREADAAEAELQAAGA